MPFVDLVNHGDGCDYDSSNGIEVAGTAEGEITVRYADTDPYGIFRSWGFVCERPVALSVELQGSLDTARLYIERRTDDIAAEGWRWIPKLARSNGAIRLSFLMLGSRKNPRLCRGIFRRIVRDAGFAEADEPFDKIRRANLQHFLSMIADLETVDGPMALGLRRLARHQLEALTYCFGVHEI